MSLISLLTVVLINFPTVNHQIICDQDHDCYYVPNRVWQSKNKVPALIVLHCNGATAADLDTFKGIGDSLGWIVATCHATRNHRDIFKNDSSIVKTVAKLIRNYPVDSQQVFLAGFSGQGVQALATLYLHPEQIRGVITICAHTGAQELAEPERLKGHLVYLITREKDWNRIANYEMYQSFNLWGVVCTLSVTPGEHGPGPWTEFLKGSVWLKRHVDLAPSGRNLIK
uniref:Phospholipase/carboxylesterase/thioesterase domain-containing protein n=1 Tax=candidate division WOR-3 bacterium TaxID=2052148 RepID=A0A7V3PS46_UNCW3